MSIHVIPLSVLYNPKLPDTIITRENRKHLFSANFKNKDFNVVHTDEKSHSTAKCRIAYTSFIVYIVSLMYLMLLLNELVVQYLSQLHLLIHLIEARSLLFLRCQPLTVQ